MAYAPIDDGIVDDILQRKEFYTLKIPHQYEADPTVYRNTPENDRSTLEYRSYQKFVQNFMSADTPYTRLLLNHSTGSGKTLSAIGIAMSYINYYKQESISGIATTDIGSVYIVSFDSARKAFQRDLIRFPQLGFITNAEFKTSEKLRQQASSNLQSDIDALYEFTSRIKKRLTNRKGNGFFKFIGYKALVNRVFKGRDPLTNMSEAEILEKLANGKLKLDVEMMKSFKNSLLICDEIHGVYNTKQKNNWGITIQTILDHDPSTRCVFMSATPINNSPTEIVDLLNLLVPASMRITKAELFDKGIIKPDAYDTIKRLSRGRVSYLLDMDPNIYPSRHFTGVELPGIRFLKFIQCKMIGTQLATYKHVFENNLYDSRHINDFSLPMPDGELSGCNPADIKRIALADSKWKQHTGIDVVDNIVTGVFLDMKNLEKVSSKYFAMVNAILDCIRNKRGKIMIFHTLVRMSGVMFIREILLRNGFIEDGMPAAPNTLCVICGESQIAHDEEHEYKPTRFATLHCDIDKSTADRIIDRFNTRSNRNGDDVLILLGSRVIKESYDLKAVRNIFIAKTPDNIPMLIQIIGRAVRNKSHFDLPPEHRNVAISIFTSSVEGGLSYEETRYKEKMQDYHTVQLIERAMHMDAIDSQINRGIIEKSRMDDLGDLSFDIKPTTFKLEDLKLSTFTVFHAEQEIALAVRIIKHNFTYVSPVWTYADLFENVKNPEFNVEYDTTMISEENFILALTGMLWIRSNVEIVSSAENIILDTVDKRLVVDGKIMAITQIGEYYIAMPLHDNMLSTRIDVLYRTFAELSVKPINIVSYLSNTATNVNYDGKRTIFYERYKDTPLRELTEAVCDYGVDFHQRFIEETILYIFNTWTDRLSARSVMHEFYFKMLYYYDIVGLIIFANTAKPFIYNLYFDYLQPDAEDVIDNKVVEISNIKRASRNAINLLGRIVAKTECSWSPSLITELYEKNLNKSLSRFNAIKQSVPGDQITPVTSDVLPIGHFLKKNPTFYHPIRGWFDSAEYLVDEHNWVENPVVIGYNVKSRTGIHTRFKLRTPRQLLKVHKDSRHMEKGSMCITRNKPYLQELCKKLRVITKNIDGSIITICEEIKARLIYLELIERTKGTKMKYFYNHFETAEMA